MRRLRTTAMTATIVAGLLMACSDDPGGDTSGAPATAAGATTTTTASAATSSGPTTAPAAVTDTAAGASCDRDEALASIVASGAAEAGGRIDYLECLDGFGWARYVLGGEGAQVLLSITADGDEVLDLGTSVCPSDSGMPADVAAAIAPTPAAAGDCPEVTSAGPAGAP